MQATRGERATTIGLGRKLTSWLAVAALLLQLLVTAGHFHPQDFSSLGGDACATNPSSAVGAAETVFRGSAPVLATHDDCALCFSLQIASSTAMPDGAALPVPDTATDLRLASLSTLRLRPARHLLFQTRAPPVI